MTLNQRNESFKDVIAFLAAIFKKTFDWEEIFLEEKLHFALHQNNPSNS